MSCAGRRDEVLLLASGLLEGEEAAALREHLAGGCDACAVHLAEARSLEGDLLLAVEPVTPDPELRAELLRRVGRAPQAAGTRSPAPPRSLRLRLALAAALGAVVAGAPAWLAAHRDADVRLAEVDRERAAIAAAADEVREERDELLAELEGVDDEIVELEESLELAREQVAMLRGAELQVLTLAGTEGNPEARARVFWNWDDYLCYVHASGLAPVEEGAAYALWLDTAARGRILAGTFRPGRDGAATLFVQLPKDAGEARSARITLERGEPGEAPLGPARLVPTSS